MLTSHARTPMGALADIELVTPSPAADDLRPRAVGRRVAHLCVISALSVALAMRRPIAARDAMLQEDMLIAGREIADDE